MFWITWLVQSRLIAKVSSFGMASIVEYILLFYHFILFYFIILFFLFLYIIYFLLCTFLLHAMLSDYHNSKNPEISSNPVMVLAAIWHLICVLLAPMMHLLIYFGCFIFLSGRLKLELQAMEQRRDWRSTRGC